MSGDLDGSRPGRAERRKSFPVRLAFWGLVLVPLSAVVGALAGNVTGVFAAVPLVVPAVVVALVLRMTGRGLTAALVVGVLLLLGSLVFGAVNIRHPQSFADFVPAVWRTAGVCAAVAGATLGLVRRRRGVVPATTAQSRALIVGAGLLVGVAGVSAVLTATGHTTVAAPRGAVEVTMKDDSFVPDEIHARPGAETIVLVRNVDSYAHTFTIDELNIDQYVGPRSERLIRFTMPATASKPLRLYCAVTGHEDMTAKIVVVAG